MIVVLLITGLFAYWTFQLRLVTSFGDLVPQSHEFVKIHNKYSGTFGGANNIVVMFTVEDGTIFTKEQPHQHLQDDRGHGHGLRRQPQPDRVHRSPHGAPPARSPPAARSAPSP